MIYKGVVAGDEIKLNGTVFGYAVRHRREKGPVMIAVRVAGGFGVVALAMALTTAPTWAQSDLSGKWAARYQEDFARHSRPEWPTIWACRLPMGRASALRAGPSRITRRGAVPRHVSPYHLPRAHQLRILGRARSEHAGAGGDPAHHQHLRPDAHNLHGGRHTRRPSRGTPDGILEGEWQGDCSSSRPAI